MELEQINVNKNMARALFAKRRALVLSYNSMTDTLILVTIRNILLKLCKHKKRKNKF